MLKAIMFRTNLLASVATKPFSHNISKENLLREPLHKTIEDDLNDATGGPCTISYYYRISPSDRDIKTTLQINLRIRPPYAS